MRRFVNPKHQSCICASVCSSIVLSRRESTRSTHFYHNSTPPLIKAPFSLLELSARSIHSFIIIDSAANAIPHHGIILRKQQCVLLQLSLELVRGVSTPKSLLKSKRTTCICTDHNYCFGVYGLPYAWLNWIAVDDDVVVLSLKSQKMSERDCPIKSRFVLILETVQQRHNTTTKPLRAIFTTPPSESTT